jgi:plastocyanin
MSSAPSPDPSALPGTIRYRFRFGPLDVAPGQNLIRFSQGEVPKPPVDGWITRIAPDLLRADGKAPPVDVLHLHHGVWLNRSRQDATRPAFPERFFAAGEEKTTTQLPPGFGYRYAASDDWVINEMLHNLTPVRDQVWLAYDLDFLPATAPAAAAVRAARPIWLDVRNGDGYPVFDVLRGSGREGEYTYPDDAPPTVERRNAWTVDHDGVLVAAAGHLHPGGLWDDVWLDRAGSGAHLFRSEAVYWEPAGAVSWDVGMTTTPPTWRATVKAGDTLRVTATYDTSRASWYESMGIVVAWMADGSDGPDPFATPVDAPGQVTHGHLPENDNHGGTGQAFADPATRARTPAPPIVDITGYVYAQGDMEAPGPIPTVRPGQTLTFRNLDAPLDSGTWHTITACRAPCNAGTGIAYPLADADVPFDSGELGTGGAPTADRVDWSTPTDLAPGLYTYFCRIHPFMRGAFAVEG